MRAGLALVIVIASALLVTSGVRGLEVYESELSKNTLLIRLSDDEAALAASDSAAALDLARDAVRQAMGLVDVPESITGKAAFVVASDFLATKYEYDMRWHARRYGQGFTMKYVVDFGKLRVLWAKSELGDPFVPGSPAAKQLLKGLNLLLNSDRPAKRTSSRSPSS